MSKDGKKMKSKLSAGGRLNVTWTRGRGRVGSDNELCNSTGHKCSAHRTEHANMHRLDRLWCPRA